MLIFMNYLWVIKENEIFKKKKIFIEKGLKFWNFAHLENWNVPYRIFIFHLSLMQFFSFNILWQRLQVYFIRYGFQVLLDYKFTSAGGSFYEKKVWLDGILL
jgi:hypothetical protein